MHSILLGEKRRDGERTVLHFWDDTVFAPSTGSGSQVVNAVLHAQGQRSSAFNDSMIFRCSDCSALQNA